MMDFSAEFQRAWAAEFPDAPHPCHPKLCACLSPASSASSPSALLVDARMAQLEEVCLEFTAAAERLETEARQQRFVANFLDRVVLKLSSADSESSNPESPLCPPVLRGAKYSLVSPMVPRGTLSKVKDALRRSGMLLDSDDEAEGAWFGGQHEEEEEEEAVKGFRKLERRPAYVSRGKGKERPMPGVDRREEEGGEDAETDSLDDYLYDSLSDADEPAVPGKEEIEPRVSSKPFHGADLPPAPTVESAEDTRHQSNVYVSLETIRRKKHDSQVLATPLSTPGKKTLHDRLSTLDTWKSHDTPVYEQLSDLSSASDLIGHRRARADDEENPYELATCPDDDAFEVCPPGDCGERQTLDLSAAAVQRRLALAYQRPLPPGGQTLEQQATQQQQQRLHGVPWQFDHSMMLKQAAGDCRRQELIHILKSEETHLQLLEIMNGYHRIFLAYNFPVQKIDVIFGHVAELRQTQETFVTKMAGRLNDWRPGCAIADVFSVLYDYEVLKTYISNLPAALEAFEELIAERKDITERLEVIVVQGNSIMFRDLLQQPVVWLTKSSENMKRMIEHTPMEHPDRGRLETLLAQLLGLVRSGTFGGATKDRAVSMIGSTISDGGSRTLVRHSLLVELTSGSSQRKLRHLFLFTDMLVCAKPRVNAVGAPGFEVRWVIPVAQVVIYKVSDQQSEETRSKRKAEIETLKNRIKELRREIKKEDGSRSSNVRGGNLPRRKRSSFRRWNWAPGRRGVDKLKEQLHKTQAQLVLASPNLEFKISSSNEKKHTLLMSSEFERREWSDSINALKNGSEKAPPGISTQPSLSEVQILLEDYKDMVSVNKLGSCLLHDGQEGVISGILKVTVHRVEGLKEPINCIVCIEVDSFEHFDLFAKTTSSGPPSCDPEINQEFDIELEFSTTVRFIVCQESVDAEGKTSSYQNIAKLELRLDIDSLSHYVETPHGLATFADPSHSILLTLSLAYMASFQTLARQQSDRRAALFGVPLEKVVRREVQKLQRAGEPVQVPLIIRACTEELDRRALEEPGIYRISGMNADVAKLKSSFDQNVTATSRLLEDYEVHVISGVLKAYLRELPEPLFTVERYRDFMDAFELSPIEVKREAFLRLLASLPEPNLSTARHLLRHFARINRKSDINKMVAGNLGLIFGPTLLSPASSVLPCDILSVTMESFKQSGTLTFMIALTTEGRVFEDGPAPAVA